MEAEDAEELELFKRNVERFFDKHAQFSRYEEWKRQGFIPREFWEQAAKAGLLGISIDTAYGGGGGSFRHEAVLASVIYERGLDAFALPMHNAMIAPYIESYGTEAQKRRWLPGMSDGRFIAAIAMTEPHAGSDLQAMRTTARLIDGKYLINGQKTFISSGQTANLIVLACKTGHGARSRDITLIVLETEALAGFTRGRKLQKMGLEAADTSELFFEDVEVPPDQVLGTTTGLGFRQMMEKLPQERLMIAIQGLGTIKRALSHTLSYVKQREAFGKKIWDFQNTQFEMAECATEAAIAEVFVEHCIELHLSGQLSPQTAAMAKYWVTDTQCRIVDRCLQLHGGYGFMLEYPIAQMYRDSRVQKIYGGANEIMKSVIARSL
jgi:acyl-CoA dehydrogenase